MANTETIADEKVKMKQKVPNKFKVILLNDDKTPVDWVIGVLKAIFRHSNRDAQALTMTIHNEGSAVVGTYTHEIAEEKLAETINASRQNGFPLGGKLEEEA